MADINVERKETSIWPWIIGLLVILLLAWLLFSLLGDDGDEVAVEPVAEEVQPLVPGAAPEPIAQGAATCVAEIMESPATWTGQTIGCEVRVVEVPTDRGFIVEDQGEQIMVVLNDMPSEEPLDINPGQAVRLSEAMVRESPGNIPGNIDADTRRLLEQRTTFLTVDEENVNILTQGNPQPGTDPAQTAPGTGM